MRRGRPPSGPVDTAYQAVYVMSVPSGHIKIGRSSHPEGRLGLLQTGHHELITLLGSSQINNETGISAAAFEREIHRRLVGYRTNGEWFAVSYDRFVMAYKRAWYKLARPEVYERYIRFCRRVSP